MRARNGSLILLSVYLVLFSLFSAISISASQTAEASEVSKDLCKLKYLHAGDTTLGFPRNPNRLPNLSSHKHLFVAVDFPDARYAGDAVELIERVMKPKDVADFYLFNSFGKVKIDYYIYPEIVTLPKSSSTYGGNKYNSVLVDGVWSNDLIHRAALKIIDEKLDLSSFSAMATIVTKGESLSESGGLASPWSPGTFTFKNGSFHNASLIGGGQQIDDKNPDLWNTRWMVVAHEIGHLYGFTDLYKYNGEFYKGYTTGPFDTMANVFSWAPTFTAWHRWLLDWVRDKEVICLDKNNISIELKLTDLNIEGGTKAVVIRLSSSKVLVIESRKNNKFDFLGPNEGLFVYTVDMNIKSGEGAVRALSDSNLFTDQAYASDIHDIDRFLTGTLRESEYLVHEGIFIKNASSSPLSDTVIISSNSDAIEMERKAKEDRLASIAEFEKLKLESGMEGNLYIAGDCQPTGTIATFQVLESGVWKDLQIATEWVSSNDCVNTPRSTNAIWKPLVVTKLKSYVSYRWKFQQWSPRILPSYSRTAISPQSKADAEAEAKAAAELKAKLEAEAKAATNKKVTITCVKGKLTKKVTAVNPKCPAGYKKR